MESPPILTQHEKKLDAWLRTRSIPPCDVPDLRQETYRKTLRYCQKHEVTGDVLPLLLYIAKRVVSDYVRARKIAANGAPRLAEEDLSTSDPEHELNEREIEENLNEILEVCSEPARALLRARFDEEKTFDEIAKEMNMPLSTAHFLVGKAIKELAEELREKRKIERYGLMPFIEETVFNGDGDGNGEAPPSEPTSAPKSDAPMTIAAARSPRNLPKEINAWPAFLLLGAAAGGIAVYLWLQREPVFQLQHVSGFMVSVLTFGDGSTSPTSRSVPGGVFGPQNSIVCPAPVAVPEPAPPPPVLPPKNKDSTREATAPAKNRDIYHAFERAYRAGDCATAEHFRSMLTGSFAEAVAGWPRCQPR